MRSAVVIVLLLVIWLTWSKACSNETSRPTTPQPAPTVHRAEWETDLSKLSPGDRDEGRDISRQLVRLCSARDPHGDTWDALQRITVEKIDVFDLGVVWTISAKFEERAHFDVLRGNTLWYRVTLDHQHVFPMKDVSGDVCDLTAEQWTPPWAPPPKAAPAPAAPKKKAPSDRERRAAWAHAMSADFSKRSGKEVTLEAGELANRLMIDVEACSAEMLHALKPSIAEQAKAHGFDSLWCSDESAAVSL